MPATESESRPEASDQQDVELLDALSGAAGRASDTLANTDVFAIVISDINLRLGIRAEKGITLEGSVYAVTASGLSGSRIFSIDPDALWGVTKGRCNEAWAGLNGPESESVLGKPSFILFVFRWTDWSISQ